MARDLQRAWSLYRHRREKEARRSHSCQQTLEEAHNFFRSLLWDSMERCLKNYSSFPACELIWSRTMDQIEANLTELDLATMHIYSRPIRDENSFCICSSSVFEV